MGSSSNVTVVPESSGKFEQREKQESGPREHADRRWRDTL